jgi:hypothetical protein
MLPFRSIGLTVGFLLLMLAAPAFSSAASDVAINTLKPELEAAETGEGSKLKLEFTNITDGPAILTVAAVGQPGCTPTLSSDQLPPNKLTPVEVEIPKSGCKSDDGALKLNVIAELAGGVKREFLVEPEGTAPGKPDWEVLFIFPILLLLSLAAAARFLFKGWDPPDSATHSTEGTETTSTGGWAQARKRLRRPLTAIDVSTWKFNDNWATNVTAAGALLTGLFGATTAKAFLGEDAESLTALATVGAAVAAAFVVAAPIAVLATKRFTTDKDEPGDFFSVVGVPLTAAAVVTAAIGQLAIIAYTATELDIGIVAKVALWIAFAIGAGLVIVYACRTLVNLIKSGTSESPKKPAVEIEAATVIAAELAALRKEIAIIAGGGDLERERRYREYIAVEEEGAPAKPVAPAEPVAAAEPAASLPSYQYHRSALI